ncbi:N-acetylglucosamine kinase [Bacillus salitolerans]|uniref:N-acetylglucosamine kinase n=1 Tax=Bacillus salitolerans TaxID=1437434 RepID=A0ABW4LN54_9BACI
MYIIGIDGGGTKTMGVICDLQGRVLAKAKVGPTNPNSLGYELVEKELKKLLEELYIQDPNTFNRVTSSFAGMSGVDQEIDKEKMVNIYRRLLPPLCDIQVDNDAITALYSGTIGNPGVVNISGTGSITFGINDENDRARVGGWGFMLDDQGSGFSIGKRAIKAVFEEFDGYGSNTSLTPGILQSLNLQSPPEMLPIIYDFTKSRETIASLSKLVIKIADDGDPVAAEILHQAAKEMGLNIRRLILKLFKDQERENPIPVVLAGGVYQKANWFIPAIKEKLVFNHLKTMVLLPDLPPVGGSAIAAITNSKLNIDRGFVNQFIQTMGGEKN